MWSVSFVDSFHEEMQFDGQWYIVQFVQSLFSVFTNLLLKLFKHTNFQYNFTLVLEVDIQYTINIHI